MTTAANDDGTDAVVVAHVTYGDPDTGTSIDLRRFDDGEISCAVYIDLSCVALAALDTIAEVRDWLGTLPSDTNEASPSVALAATDTGQGVDPRWSLVDAEERARLVADGTPSDMIVDLTTIAESWKD